MFNVVIFMVDSGFKLVHKLVGKSKLEVEISANFCIRSQDRLQIAKTKCNFVQTLAREALSTPSLHFFKAQINFKDRRQPKTWEYESIIVDYILMHLIPSLLFPPSSFKV
jgi:hypothetical protein